MSDKTPSEQRESTEVAPPKADRGEPARSELRQATIEVGRAWRGPLPPPEVLARYQDVLPDAPERILAMAERQSAHRQRCEWQVVRHNTRLETIASILGFVTCMSLVAGGIFLLYHDKSIGGLVALAAGLGPIVAAFLGTRVRQRKAVEAAHRADEQ